MASARARSRGVGAGGDSSASLSTPDGASTTNSSTRRLVALILATAIAVLALAGFLARAAPHTTAELLRLPVLDPHNIGNVRTDDYLAYGPIDVVYTWVNGTDPRWKAEKEYWHKHWIASLTGQPLPVKRDDTAHVKGSDTANADNRFRDNEELRYSLRSLEKYAPWIRHIYIVTDGQIPSWLNLESPKIQIVPHRAIFANQSHLPVFSSPAIEWSLDNIPGLSDSFLYFNDDVFLGAPVRPEDFVSQAGVQKVYLAWEIPLCAPGCWDTSLQNGRCDRECNVTACDFDMGDCGCDVDPTDGTVTCDPVKVASLQETSPITLPKPADYLCDGLCHYKWIGDGGCDTSCNVSTCGFDAGDCSNRLASPASLLELPVAHLTTNETLVSVPLTINATYVNLTRIFGINGSIDRAEHDNEKLVRHASVFERELLLLLVFGRDDAGDAATGSAAVTVYGKDANGASIRLELAIVRGQRLVASAHDAGFFTFQNTTIAPRSVRLPFGLRQATIQDRKDHVDELGSESDVASDLEGHETDRSTTFLDDDDNANDAAAREYLEELELVLPFNLTGKHLREGDVLQLGYDVTLRLHDDVADDYDWSEFQLCRVHIPDTKATAIATAKTEKANDVGSQSAESVAAATSSSSSSSSDDEAVDTLQELIQSPSPSRQRIEGDSHEAVDEQSQPPQAPPLQRQNAFSFDTLDDISALPDASAAVDSAQPPSDDAPQLDADADAATVDSVVVPEDPIPLCRIVDSGRAIAVTFRIPTFKTRALATTASHVVSETASERVVVNTPAAIPTTDSSDDADATITTVATTTTVTATSLADVDNANDGTPSRPQIVDGAICLFNNDMGDAAKRYCFALALGHFFHDRRTVEFRAAQRAAMRAAARPKVTYTPFVGAPNDARIELRDACIDTTLRSVGLAPRVCDLLDVPRVLPRDAATDWQHTNDVDGRRLACEAQQRRRAQLETQRIDDAARRAAAMRSVVGAAQLWVVESLARVLLQFGLSMLDAALDVNDIDDVEYDDVCSPLLASAATKKPEISAANADALLSKDTFGDSLRFVNKLYNRAFGKASDRRRVPSHMPFLFHKRVIREIKARWPREVDATSTHRFRHPQDMQFSFAYFHYVLNRHKVVTPTLMEIWHEYLDVNRNGILDENELLTVASLAHGDYPPDAVVDDVRKCLQPPKQERVREAASAKGTVRVTETLTPHVTFANLEACTSIRDQLLANVRREKQAELMSEREVTFHMLSENYRFAWNQMLGTRARRTKFVCINDDMKYPSTAVSQILHELFLSIWPKRSQFELPYHLKNRYAHIDEYNDARARRQTVAGVLVGLCLLVALYFRRELRALFGFQDIARARAASASKLSADLQRQLSGEVAGGDDDDNVSDNDHSSEEDQNDEKNE